MLRNRHVTSAKTLIWELNQSNQKLILVWFLLYHIFQFLSVYSVLRVWYGILEDFSHGLYSTFSVCLSPLILDFLLSVPPLEINYWHLLLFLQALWWGMRGILLLVHSLRQALWLSVLGGFLCFCFPLQWEEIVNKPRTFSAFSQEFLFMVPLI